MTLPHSAHLPGSAVRSNATHRPFLRRWLIGGALLTAFLLGAVVLGVGFGMELDMQEAVLGFATALIPVAIVVPAFLWLDRQEAEPVSSLVVAFAWGALVATAFSYLANSFVHQVLWELALDADLLTPVLVAPVVEESAKGLGILVVWLMRKREFDGVLDGIVYAGVIAAGFAMAENVLYLGRALAEAGAAGLAVTFVLRGLVSPFAHPLFTIWIGIGIGLLVEKRGALRILAPFVGLAVAIGLHAAWNAAASLPVELWIGTYLMFHVPVFLATVVFVIWVRRREAGAVRSHLEHYTRAGVLSGQDLRMLGEARTRTQARAWARHHGGRAAGRAMQDFQDDAIELAFLRARYLRGHAGPRSVDEERRLIESLTTARDGVRSALLSRR
ncbi:MAG: PrsW family glutamic-type intramembrane protease [Mobilicoccus sp.]|nr:PrsW family glutamic-type intramembrane protease [Mobilicoccus sp.]